MPLGWMVSGVGRGIGVLDGVALKTFRFILYGTLMYMY